ncbi:MAG: hypothetical protein GDA51_04510 [Ekhidna sp.]|nr:hypothetical protein [Ekhidna sp.]
MAKNDREKEREEDDFFGDNEDFGLPSLDYEALDDDDPDDDMSFDESFDDEEVSTDIEDDFDITDSSFDDNQETISQTDEEVGQESEIDSSGFEEPFEEGSFDSGESDFEIEDEDFDDSVFNSDTPDDEFKELEDELMDSGNDFGDNGINDSFSSDDSFATDEEYGELILADEEESGSKGKFAKIVIVGLVILLGLGTLFYFLSPSFSGEGEKPKVVENTQPVTPDVKAQPTTTEEEEKPIEQLKEDFETQKKEDTQSKKPRTTVTNNVSAANTGKVTSLRGKTGKFYIIVASFLDRDLAMDHSRDLANSGKRLTIIPPFGNAVTHRVAIQGYGSLSQALGAINDYKGTYGEDIWVLKY